MQSIRFNEKNPQIEDFYTEEEKERAYKHFIIGIVVGVGLILTGCLFVIMADARLEKLQLADKMQVEKWEYYINGIFMMIVTAAVSLLTFTALQDIIRKIILHLKRKREMN